MFIVKNEDGETVQTFDNSFAAENFINENGGTIYVKCTSCGEEIELDEAEEIDGDYYCESCKEENFFWCEHCEQYHPIDEQNIVNVRCGTEYWCEDCTSDDAFWCHDCEEYYSINDYDAYETAYGYTICENCRNEDYYYCDNCDQLFNNDDIHYDEEDDCYYCDNCYDEMSDNSRVQGYHCRPKMVCYGDNEIEPMETFKGYGIELEIDGKNYIDRDIENNAVDMLNDKLKGHTYYNRDGSLNYGFEIITQPHTRKAMEELDWQTALEKLVELGYRSHDVKTCGLHMHASRNCFGATEEERTTNIAKVILFYEKWWEDILKFSRRTQSQANQWAANYGCSNMEQSEKIVKGEYYTRYKAINLCNRNTVEFRLMRGTLNYKTFVATLDFLMKIVENAPKITNIDDLSQWLDGIKPETIEYMKSRNCFGYTQDITEQENDTTDQEIEQDTICQEEHFSVNEDDFVVGARVQFKTLDEIIEEYGEHFSLTTPYPHFSKDMTQLCGTYATIENINGDDVWLKDFTFNGDTMWNYAKFMLKVVKE